MAKNAPQTFRLDHPLSDQRGTYLILAAIVIVVIIGFAALGVEVGRWYAIQGELGKAADGAAFAGAKNVDNPNVDLETLAKDVAEANFSPGLLGTDNNPIFNVTENRGRVTVDGTTNSLNPLAPGFNKKYHTTQIGAEGAAKLRRAEIALILDISRSMGRALENLKDGARTFVENFEDQESRTKMALLVFASGVKELHKLDHNFTSPMTTAINVLKADGTTNTEYALHQAGALPWENQSGLPRNEQAVQAVVFFSDGNPFGFHDEFIKNGVSYEASAAGGNPLAENDESNKILSPEIRPTNLGDGLPPSDSACGPAVSTVKWKIFEHPDYGFASGIYPPLAGTDPEYCGQIYYKDLGNYSVAVSKKMALENAKKLKNRGIQIYTIGLGNIDQNFLTQLASGPDFRFWTADAQELEGLFQKIANRLKLVLVK